MSNLDLNQIKNKLDLLIEKRKKLQQEHGNLKSDKERTKLH